MKRITIFSIALLSTLMACNNESQTLAEKKTALKKVKQEINALELKADSLMAQIERAEGTEKIKKINVLLDTIIPQTFESFIEVQGTSQAENNVNLSTDIGGLVTAVYVTEGQYVSKGKTLIQLDNTIARNQLAELNTSIELAKSVYEKRQRLWSKNIGSEIEYLQAKNNYESLEKKKKTLQTQISKSAIKASISGKIDAVNLKVGELASPGMPAINIVNLSKMEVEVNVPEAYLSAVKKGNKIMVAFPTLQKEIQATVKAVAQSINPMNRTFKVIASVNNKNQVLKPNLLAKIKIKNTTKENAIVIPAYLLQKSSKGYFVYTAIAKDNDFYAKEVNVSIGESYNGYIVITEGLQANDLLVTEGYRNVLDGDVLLLNKVQ